MLTISLKKIVFITVYSITFFLSTVALATTYTVNDTGDGADADTTNSVCETANGNGVCTLRAAIGEANANDTINFNISGCSNNECTIQPASALPTISAAGVTINGYTQTGATTNSNATGAINADIQIIIDGTNAGASVDGLAITGGTAVIKGLSIINFTDRGIEISSSGSNKVQGCFLGMNPDGTTTGANTNSGIRIASDNNIVGRDNDTSPDAAERNLISGNGSGSSGTGITFGSTADSNTVAGNLIGLDKDGTALKQNGGTGVLILGGASGGNTIGTNGNGTNDSVELNVISGNLNGIFLDGTSSANVKNNIIAGNYIGTMVNGTSDGGNRNQGILVDGSSTNAAPADNIIGGDDTNEKNIIAFNGDGAGGATNECGIKIDGSNADNTKIQRNSIFDNQDKGIFLTNSGNDSEATPSITAGQTANGNNLDISGTAGASETIEIFIADNETDGNDEGKTYLGQATSNGSGAWTYTVTDSTGKALNTELVVTATSSTNDTSEFSASYTVTNQAPVATAQSASTNQDTAKALTLAGTDANGNTITFATTGCTDPSKGLLSGLNATTGAITYTPNAGQTGSDSFGFKVNDGTADSSCATVSMTIDAFTRTVTFSSASQSGAESAGTLTFTADLSSASAHNVTVPFTLSGTATNGSGSDYTITSDPLTITAGGTSATITITVNNDVLDEDDETIIVTMGTLTNASQGATTGVRQICR